MKRVLLISLSLFLALVGWSAVCAGDGFYVIGGGGKSASVPKTGQITSYGTGDDGALQKGVAWPIPRFTDNGNGTVTDNLTKLVWTKNANMFGTLQWQSGSTYPACNACATLNNGEHDLSDGSAEGDWRLPNVRELQSLIDYGFNKPALPDTLGTGKWTEGNPFQGVQSSYFWSSTTSAFNDTEAWLVYMDNGAASLFAKPNLYRVWCVRGGP